MSDIEADVSHHSVLPLDPDTASTITDLEHLVVGFKQ